jgi:hypothetical protein
MTPTTGPWSRTTQMSEVPGRPGFDGRPGRRVREQLERVLERLEVVGTHDHGDGNAVPGEDHSVVLAFDRSTTSDSRAWGGCRPGPPTGPGTHRPPPACVRRGGDHGRRRRADIQSPSVARFDRRGDGGDIDGEVDEGEWPKRLHHLTDDLRLHGCDGSTGAGVATTTSGCT